MHIGVNLMHLVFIDIIYGYTADRPDMPEALGGTTTAVCFMAREMTKAGIKCSLVNPVEEKKTAHGITTYPLASIIELCDDPSVSAFIFCGRWNAEFVELLKQRTRVPFIAWMHESCFEPRFVQPLPQFEGIVFVSNWQAKTNEANTSFRWKKAIIQNAMHPCFADIFADGENILDAKSDPPTLFFAGDFPRGAFHIMPVLDELRSIDQNFAAEIFTSATFSPNPKTDKEYSDKLKNHPNISHVGKVGQIELAARAKKAAIMIAPNPWPETSCINLIQSMTAGMLCVITDRAVLPETANGFARIVPMEDRDNPSSFNMKIDHKAFAKEIAAALEEWRSNKALEEKLQDQRKFFLDHYQWSQRVQPWVNFITQMSQY